MDISTAYKQHQQVKDLHSQIDEVVAEIKKVDFAYKVAFVGTFVLYFCFIWGMYVADLWGFTTWLTNNISEFVALIIYGILAVTLPLTMALIKEIAYKHFSNYQNSTGMIILIVGILALAGVLYESITSSSQQQHMSFNSAENSKTFAAITQTSTATGGTVSNYGSLIGRQQQIVARCEVKLAAGKEKHCDGDKAKLTGLLESEARLMQSNERASVAAIETKQKAIQDLKEEQHKPVFKAIRDSLGVSINTGIMTVTIFVSAIFEISHLLLIMLGAQKKKRLMGLNAALINAESDYMRSTGKTFKVEDFSDDSVLDMNTVREKSPNPIGFGAPAMAFKYQEEKKRNPVGFVRFDTDNKSANIQQNHPTPTTSKSGTWNNELKKTGIHSPADYAMNQSADDEQIKRIISKGKSVSKASEKASEKAFSNRPRTVPDGFKKASDKLYFVWVKLMEEGAIKPTTRPAKKLISEHLCSQRKAETITPAQIDLVIKEWISRALSAGIIQENKGASNGQAKYFIA